jgi:hypothetical protein
MGMRSCLFIAITATVFSCALVHGSRTPGIGKLNKKQHKRFLALIKTISGSPTALDSFEKALKPVGQKKQIQLLQWPIQEETLLHYAARRSAFPIICFLASYLPKILLQQTADTLLVLPDKDKRTFLHHLIAAMTDQQAAIAIEKLNLALQREKTSLFDTLMQTPDADNRNPFHYMWSSGKYQTAAKLYLLNKSLFNKLFAQTCEQELGMRSPLEAPLDFKEPDNTTLLHHALRNKLYNQIPFLVGLVCTIDLQESPYHDIVLGKTEQAEQTWLHLLCTKPSDTQAVDVLEKLTPLLSTTTFKKLFPRLIEAPDYHKHTVGSLVVLGERHKTAAWLVKRYPELIWPQIRSALKEKFGLDISDNPTSKSLSLTILSPTCSPLHPLPLIFLVGLLSELEIPAQLAPLLKQGDASKKNFLHHLFAAKPGIDAISTLEKLFALNNCIKPIIGELLQQPGSNGCTPLHEIAKQGIPYLPYFLSQTYGPILRTWALQPTRTITGTPIACPSELAHNLYLQACAEEAELMGYYDFLDKSHYTLQKHECYELIERAFLKV